MTDEQIVRPFVVASECPWPVRNGVTAKTARLFSAWDPSPLVLCPDHPIGSQADHERGRNSVSAKPGKKFRAASLLKAALRRGWTVKPGLEPGRIMREFEAGLTSALPQFVHFDTVATEHLIQPVRASLDRREVRVPLILSVNDCISQLRRTRPRRGGLWGRLDTAMMEAAERRAYPQADAVDVVTQTDVTNVLRIAPTSHVRMIPLGFTKPMSSPDHQADRRIDVLIFATDLDWRFLADDFLVRLRRLAPNACVAVVGSAGLTSGIAASLDQLDVEQLGFVENLEDTLRQTRVVIAPSQQLAGTPNKARDGMAHGAAVVGGRCLTGLPGFFDNEHGIVADSGATMAEATCRLLADEDTRRQLAAAAYELIAHYPDWSAVAAAYVEQLPRVTARING